MKNIFLGLLCFLFFSVLTVQSQTTNAVQDYIYKQKVSPSGFDNYLFSTYYYNSKKVYNLRNSLLSNSSNPVSTLKINPSGSSYAVLSTRGNESLVSIFDLWTANHLLHEFEEVKSPTTICYTADAKLAILADAKDQLFFYDTRDYTLQHKMEIPFSATQLNVSNNNFFLAAAHGKHLSVWTLETKSLRKEFILDSSVNDIAFSDDSNVFAVLTDDGLLTTYDTKTFLILQSLDAMGYAKHCHFHPEGKYILVVTGDSSVSVINLLDEKDRIYINNKEGNITEARFVKDGKGQIYLVYNTKSSIIYKLMSKLSPFYKKLLADELNDRMSTWLKMMDGETLEEYNQRVNNETRIQQMLLIEHEIATRMADNLLEKSEVKLGSYNPEANMLAIDFNTMPSIYLNIPAEDITDFMDSGSLEFRNTIYGLTKIDGFELIYADVFNKKSGKTYTFNNLNQESLDYLKLDENFVPLQLIQQSNMEELKLKEIKDRIITAAKKKNVLSDKTKISVNATVVSGVNAKGEKTMNYKIGFSYQVDKQYSAQEDFMPGKYKASQSGAARSMLSIVKTAFETEFAQYVMAGKKLEVKITGMADSLPINGLITYDGCYGDFINEPVYKDNDLSNITVTQKSGITQNDQLAFLRSIGVKDFITQQIPSLSKMRVDYKQYIELTKGSGGEYRRISVDFTFVNAF